MRSAAATMRHPPAATPSATLGMRGHAQRDDDWLRSSPLAVRYGIADGATVRTAAGAVVVLSLSAA